jgi:hypothetical protein
MNRRTISIAALVALALLVAGAAVAFGNEAAVTVSPDQGNYGQVFKVNCTGFAPGIPATQYFYYPDGSPAGSVALLADATGDLGCIGWIASEGEPLGVYKVVVVLAQAYEPFEVFFEVLGVEFVPEPGTVLLLGSGLMGLAGYAGLRWRSRDR